MSESAIVTIAVALLGGIQAVLVALIAAQSSRVKRIERRTGRIEQDARATVEQTQNSHQKNLREDLDDKHEVLVESVSGVQRTLDEHGREIGGLRSDLRQLRAADLQASERITNLERDRRT